MAPTNAWNSSSAVIPGGPGVDEGVGEAASGGVECVEAVGRDSESIGAGEGAAAEEKNDEDVEASCRSLEGCLNSGHSSGSRWWEMTGGCSG